MVDQSTLLWNTFLVAGIEDGEPYLGCVDKIGTAFSDSKIATGYGAHIALPLMREALEKKPQMTKEEARALLINCLRVLFYRDCRALNKVGVVLSSMSRIPPVLR
jgi:20S proteasome subunit beta 7